MSQHRSELQKLEPSALIALFTLDCTSVGGTLMHFVQAAHSAIALSFGGTIYQPIDVSFEGLETSGVGALPTPSLILANTDGLIQAAVNTWGDLNGCVLTRIRTFARFLDGQPDADNTAFFGPDIYRIERKVSDTPVAITWELSASIDQEGKILPGRSMIRSTCLWRYRNWDNNTASFDYSRAQCPYTGSLYWDDQDEPTTADKDRPSRTKNCCRLRFGKNQPWPFGGFLGMGRAL